MAEDKSSLMAEFEEFLSAKKEKETADAESEDFDLEIFDEKGRGVRTKRSHAKPFLQTLGLDLDPEPPKDDNGGEDKTKPKPKPRQSKPAQNNSLTRKYFTSGK